MIKAVPRVRDHDRNEATARATRALESLFRVIARCNKMKRARDVLDKIQTLHSKTHTHTHTLTRSTNKKKLAE